MSPALAYPATLASLVDRLGENGAAVASVIHEALMPYEREPRLIRADVTERAVSYVVALGHPLPLMVGGRREDVQGGLLVVGSGAERASLSMTLSLTRASCGNTVSAPNADATVLRPNPRGLDLPRLRARIVRAVRGSPELLCEGVRVLEEASHHEVADAPDEVRALLRRSRLPVSLMGDVVEAYAHERHQTRFGIAQAVAWAAQRVDPETRWKMEWAAGRYLARSS